MRYRKNSKGGNIYPPYTVIRTGKAVPDHSQLKRGCIVMPGCTLGDDVTIGDDCYIGHDCIVGQRSIWGHGAMAGDDVCVGVEPTIRSQVRFGQRSVAYTGLCDVVADLHRQGRPYRTTSDKE